MKQVANGTSTFYLWSSVFGQPALELNSSGGVVRAYVFSSSGQRIATQASNGSFYWVHGDHLGSSHKLTDTSGNVAYTAEYDPHGNLRFESGTTTLTTRKFTGYERDAANLDFAQARTLEYRFGRFMQPDPLGLGAGDMANPQSLNLYSYVQNDPINFIDPTGLNCQAFTYEWSGWIGDTYHVNQTRVVWVCDGNFGGGGGGPIDSGGGGGGSILDGIQTGLDIAGLVPGLGEIADACNGLISLGRGDYAGAALSGAAIPFAGWGATAGKLGRKATNLVNPSAVKFSQPTVSMNFSSGGTINDTAAALRSGATKVSDIPTIRVVEHNGNLVTLDNRRLLAFHEAGVESIPVQRLSLADPAIKKEFARKFNPVNGGNNIVVTPNAAGRCGAEATLRQHGKIN